MSICIPRFPTREFAHVPPAAGAPVELAEANRAYAANLLRYRFAPEGAGDVPLALLANPLVREVVGLRSAPHLRFDDAEEDELEPWGRGEEAPQMSKLWFNRMLESNPVPAIWTTNRVEGLDPAFLRRFKVPIEFGALGPEQRRVVWSRVAPELGAAEVDALAREEVSPGEIASSVEVARLAGGGALDREVLGRIVAGAVRAIPGRRPAPALRAGAEYRIELVNASVDLVRLADRLAGWSPSAGAGLALCLHGPSGTGKSEFVHHLARRMGRAVLVRNVSDLHGMFVGETERNLAAAFREAADAGAVLLLDEADGFLRDRRAARNSWEVTIANELLQQLEAFRGIVACTTNLFQELDPAALRRFTHKIEFLPLRAEQRVRLFDALLLPLLARGPSPGERARIDARLGELHGLVPGDYAAVARRVRLEGEAAGPEGIVDELMAELAARSPRCGRVGFWRAPGSGPAGADGT